MAIQLINLPYELKLLIVERLAETGDPSFFTFVRQHRDFYHMFTKYHTNLILVNIRNRLDMFYPVAKAHWQLCRPGRTDGSIPIVTLQGKTVWDIKNELEAVFSDEPGSVEDAKGLLELHKNVKRTGIRDMSICLCKAYRQRYCGPLRKLSVRDRLEATVSEHCVKVSVSEWFGEKLQEVENNLLQRMGWNCRYLQQNWTR